MTIQNIDRAQLPYAPIPTRIGDKLPDIFDEMFIQRDAYKHIKPLKEQVVFPTNMPYNTKVYEREQTSIPVTQFEKKSDLIKNFTTYYYKQPSSSNIGTGLQNREGIFTSELKFKEQQMRS